MWDTKAEKEIILKDIEAMEQVNYFVHNTNDCFSICHLGINEEEKFNEILQLSKKFNNDKKVIFDYDFIGNELKKQQLFVKGFHHACEFQVKSLEDLVAYKNRSILIDNIKTSFPEKICELKDFYSNVGNAISIDFQGNWFEFDNSEELFKGEIHDNLISINNINLNENKRKLNM